MTAVYFLVVRFRKFGKLEFGRCSKWEAKVTQNLPTTFLLRVRLVRYSRR
jgi:hypothetical protein